MSSFQQFLIDDVAYQRVKQPLTQAQAQLSEFKSAAGDKRVMVLSERPEAQKVTFFYEAFGMPKVRK